MSCPPRLKSPSVEEMVLQLQEPTARATSASARVQGQMATMGLPDSATALTDATASLSTAGQTDGQEDRQGS
jgi:hypothetical protein